MTRIKGKTSAKSKKWRDPIVAEIHEVREAHALKFKYDLNAIFRDFKDHEKILKEKASKRSSGKKTA